MDLARLGGRLVALDADLAGGLAQLGDEVLPLAHAQVVQVLGLAALAELVARERALLLAQVTPQVEVGEEVRAVVGEAGVRLVGLRALLDRTLARVDDRERSSDHDHLLRAAGPSRLEHHPAEARIDRQLRELAAQRREPAARVERRQLLQEPDAVADLAAVGRVQEREGLDVAEADRRHLQDHRGEAGAQDLRVGVARALGEVLLAVEPDADAVGLAPAAARALVGGGLGDRLDRQALDLQPRAVAADARGAGIHDRADPGHGQRGLGDVGRQHHPALAVGPEDALLLGGCQPGIERQHLHVVAEPAAQRLGGVADLALAAEEDEHVAGVVALELLDGVADRVGLVGVVIVGQRAVADLDGIGPPGDLDDRRIAEVAAEALRIDRRRGDDQLEIRPSGQQRRQVAEQEVDVQAALVGLVDDDRVVAAQLLVVADLGEQQPVGHHPHERVLPGAIAEAHGVADGLPERDAELLGDPLGHGAGGQPARLGVGDRAADPAPELQAELRQLRRLARAGLAGHDDDLVVADRGEQVLAARADRQLRRIGGHRDGAAAARDPPLGARDLLRERGDGLRVGLRAEAPDPPAQALFVA